MYIYKKLGGGRASGVSVWLCDISVPRPDLLLKYIYSRTLTAASRSEADTITELFDTSHRRLVFQPRASLESAVAEDIYTLIERWLQDYRPATTRRAVQVDSDLELGPVGKVSAEQRNLPS